MINPFVPKPGEPERIPNVEALHEYLVRTKGAKPGDLSSAVPNLPSRREICRDFFHCNIWDVEPHLLDDLHQAKKGGNENDVHLIRELIRAASWASHGRTDPVVCLQLMKQIGLDQPKIREALTRFLCDDQIEAAVQIIEDEVDRAWKEILENPKQNEAARARLQALRQIRDQLYFQRLFANICAFGKAMAS